MNTKTIFITAIDTDAGKSIVTGLLARHLHKQGKKVITYKIAQTGCEKYSEDIETHRKLMGIGMQEIDLVGKTCPYVLKYPASPHLVATMEGVKIDVDKIYAGIKALEADYDYILVEGVGGLHVPIVEGFHVIDFIEKYNFPMLLVSSSKLGSINHTFLSLEAIKNRKLNLQGAVYNHFPADSEFILKDSARMIQIELEKYFPAAKFSEVPMLEEGVEVGFPEYEF